MTPPAIPPVVVDDVDFDGEELTDGEAAPEELEDDVKLGDEVKLDDEEVKLDEEEVMDEVGLEEASVDLRYSIRKLPPSCTSCTLTCTSHSRKARRNRLRLLVSVSRKYGRRREWNHSRKRVCCKQKY
jgi:hypothetical protein